MKKYTKDEYQKMRGGELYNPTDPYLTRCRTQARAGADRYNRTSAYHFHTRTRMIQRLIPQHGTNFFLEPPIHLEYGTNIRFGNNFYCNFDCMLMDVAPIVIGDDVMFGPRVTLATPMHPLVGDERRIQQYPDGEYDLEYAKPITIGDRVWLATGVTVCGGVSIGSDVVVGAGSVVTRDIPAGMLAAGAPARVIRPITDADRLNPWATYSCHAVERE